MKQKYILRQKQAFEIKLEEEFPFMRRKEITDEAYEKVDFSVYDTCGCDVRESWYNLLRGLCLDITKAYEAYNEPVDLVVSQVEEDDAGRLRFYWHPNGYNPPVFRYSHMRGKMLRFRPGESGLYSEIAKIVSKWEEKSLRVCEICGEAGEWRTGFSGISTQCFSCYSEFKNLRYDDEPRRDGFYELLTAEDAEAITTFTDAEGVLFEERQLQHEEKICILVRYPSDSVFDSYDIPEGVHAIKADAFKDCTKLTHIHISKTVNQIAWGAFSCSGIKNISVDPDNQTFTSIHGVLFSKDKTELFAYPPNKASDSFIIPNDVIRIWHHAFKNARNLSRIFIPDNVGFIGNNAFEGCVNFKVIILPGVHLNDNCQTFHKCPSLEFIYVVKNKEKRFRGDHLHSMDGVLFKGPITHTSFNFKNGAEVKRTTHILLRYPEAKPQTSYTIPDNITHISKYAFSDQLNLRCVEIPASVIEIGEGAFDGCHQDLVFRCFENSCAHEYAKNHAIKFELV